MKKYKIGFTAGVYDMFHVGHLNIIRRAKQFCEILIVGVSTDDVVLKNKNKKPIISFGDRVQIIEALRYVDKVIPQESYSIEGKLDIVKKNNIDVMFVGSDWQGTEKWRELEKELAKIDCEVIYLPYTEGISSTILRDQINR